MILPFSIFKKLAAEFKMGREILNDYQRSEIPSTATTKENADTIHDMIMEIDDSTSHIANIIGTS